MKLTERRKSYLQFIIIAIVFALVPTLANVGILKASHITTIGGTLIYAIAALGLNLLLGYSGLISLGTAGFMGLATYVSAYVTMDLNLPFEVAFLLAILIPTVIGILVGLVSLKIEGMYLAIATLAVSEILRKTFEELDFITNGFSGKAADFPKLFGVMQLDRTSTYYLIVFVLLIIMVITYNIINGQMGRALSAMRGSEPASQAMGVNLLKYRLVAFSLSTIYASVAGVLYVHFIRFTYPSTWALNLSLDFLAMIVIGGLRSIPGTILGAFIVFAVPDLLIKQIPAFSQLSYVFNGILIILVIMFFPNGAISIVDQIRGFFTKGKEKDNKDSEEIVEKG